CAGGGRAGSRRPGVSRGPELALGRAWRGTAAAGSAPAGTATSALSASFSIPGQAFQTDAAIQRRYHTGGFQNPPVVLTATVPPGTPAGPGTAAEAGRLFAAAAPGVPGSRLADHATPRHAPLSRRGRSCRLR